MKAIVLLLCTATVNLGTVAETKTELPKSGQAQVAVVPSEDIEISISTKNGSDYELEVFDRIAPTRGYSRARLTEKGDRIGYSFWQRERLFEVDCTL